MAGEEGSTTLEFTPTWIVAAFCTVIIAISIAVERGLHLAGRCLKKNNQKHLYEALEKVKEELMLLGFISLLLTVSQGFISRICVPEHLVLHMLPCSLSDRKAPPSSSSEEHSETKHISGRLRRLLSEHGASQSSYCATKDKVPFLSVEALHHLHIFIFVLAIVHVSFCVLTVFFGGARIRQWKRWEDAIEKDRYDTEALKPKITHVHQHAFIQEHFVGLGGKSTFLGWMYSFFKQFHGSVTRADYAALRTGFIMTHCKANPKFNFHQYMIRALEDDFKHVLVSLDIRGWHTYFWIAFIPFVLLLAVGTKLEHVIIQLAHQVAEKHAAIEGELVVKPSDDHFWFNRPHLILFLIHFILFQNAFEIAFFFWIWVQYGFDSCIMGEVQYIIPRLTIGVIIQVLCSSSTLPLYAIVTQMGSQFKRAIFDDHIQAGVLGWAKKVKKKKKDLKILSNSSDKSGVSTATNNSKDVNIELGSSASPRSL
ncbi:hypothetical protein V2J09_018408 [Rumex salicifolius]